MGDSARMGRSWKAGIWGDEGNDGRLMGEGVGDHE